MAKVNKLVFKCKDFDGNDAEFAVLRPTREDETNAKIVSNAAFRQALDNGVMLRAELNEVVRARGLWDDAKEAKKKEALKEIKDMERRLMSGNMKKSEGKKLALDIISKREKLLEMDSAIRELDQKTADARDDDEYFNALISLCTVHAESGHRVFKGYEDFLDKSEEKVALEAAKTLMKLLFSNVTESRKKNPEYKFLMKYGYVNEDLHFIDEKGRLISQDGRLVNSEGRYIDEEGNYVTVDGVRIDEEGNPIEEMKEFLDD